MWFMARNWVGVYVNMAELLPMSSSEPAKKISEITRNPRINEQISFGISKLITNCIYETRNRADSPPERYQKRKNTETVSENTTPLEAQETRVSRSLYRSS